MKRQFTLVAALALAGGLSFAAFGPATATPISAPAMAVPMTAAKAETGQATTVHYRRGQGRYYRGGRHFRGHVYINPRSYRRSYRYHRRYYNGPRHYGNGYYNDRRYYGRRHFRGHGYRYHYRLPGAGFHGGR